MYYFSVRLTLFDRDLQSGSLHYIWYGLTYDLTVISAPMGTYPSFAFTPGDDAVIIWADGKIWRVPLAVNSLGEKVAGGEPRVIPFTAHIRKRLAETRSSKTDLLSIENADTQRLHAFKDLAVNDDGTRVVFEGAGKTYYFDIPSEAAVHGERTAAKEIPVLHPDQAYYSPSFVPGNEDLVIHARWSDTNFTAFELVDLSSNTAYAVTDGLQMGRYVHPILSSSSGRDRTIAFIKTGGSLLTGNVVATANPGLYIGHITLPDFHSDSSIVSSVSIRDIRHVPSEINVQGKTTMHFLDGDSRLLVQQSTRAFVIDLSDGPDKYGHYNHTTVARGRMSQEVSVSFSGDAFDQAGYIAFVDFMNVFVIDTPHAGDSPLWSKPGVAPKGLARVSLDGGHDVQWDAKGKTLFWLLGMLSVFV